MGNTAALPQAAADGDKPRVLELLRKGHNIDSQDDEGCTALIRASAIGSMSIIQILLMNGANLDIQDKVCWVLWVGID